MESIYTLCLDSKCLEWADTKTGRHFSAKLGDEDIWKYVLSQIELIKGEKQSYLLETSSQNFDYFEDMRKSNSRPRRMSEISKDIDLDGGIRSTAEVDNQKWDSKKLDGKNLSWTRQINADSFSPPLEFAKSFEVLSSRALQNLRDSKMTAQGSNDAEEVVPGTVITIDLNSFNVINDGGGPNPKWNNAEGNISPRHDEDDGDGEPAFQTCDTGQTKDSFLQNMGKIKELILTSVDKPHTCVQLMNTLLSSIKKLKDIKAQVEIIQAFNEDNKVLGFLK